MAGGAANIAIDVVAPNEIFLERRNELDMRFGKIVRLGKSRSIISVDMFNATNSNAVLTANQNFTALNASDPSQFRPTSILGARTFKISVQFDY